MKPRTSTQIRREFIDFFVEKCGHVFVPSSPCIPHGDPTLLFTNAGMNQFKPLFLGTADPNIEFGRMKRAANSQKCIRAGGKHNDLDDVGHDTYHHTFFEMLGNWSFGDYFKKEAIAWAWELLTKVWGLDPKRLHATYFQGDPAEGLEPDSEAKQLWEAILPPERVHPGNKKDNFWEMGDTGPCGPCSEIHIDMTPDCTGGPLVNAGDAQVMEIWNLVFIQFNRGPDSKLTPLPAKHVDTGMGFERISAVVLGTETNQLGKVSNYDTEVFSPIFAAIQKVTGAPAYTGLLEKRHEGTEARRHEVMKDVAYRVIGDHIRTLTFALTDGAVPSNEGRGYVLRRILRRAVRYGRQYLNTSKPFMCDLVPAVVAAMADAFPELRTGPDAKKPRENAVYVANLIREEESSFIKTLDRGIALFEEAADYAVKHHHGRISGHDAFKLHDTYGFPIDLTELMAEERGLTIDIGEYERFMEEAREKARGGGKETATIDLSTIGSLPRTDDTAKYGSTFQTHARVVGYVANGKFQASGEIPRGPIGLVLDRTLFYGEQGGQVGDIGTIECTELTDEKNDPPTFNVINTQRAGDAVVHIGELLTGVEPMSVGQQVVVEIDSTHRTLTMKNHTSTHVLNWALREVLGDNVQQRGSLVDPDKTRFDFSHHAAVTHDKLARVETLVNERISANLAVHAREVPQKDALKIHGLRAVFGEKYPDIVRVVSIGPSVDELLADPGNEKWRGYSVEFCGGTHLKSTADAKRFRLIEESAVAKGIRRVVGITGDKAATAEREAAALADRFAKAESGDAATLSATVADLTTALSSAEIPILDRAKLRERLAALQETVKKHNKQVTKSAAGDITARIDDLLAKAEKRGSTTIVCADLGDATADQLRVACDSLRAKAGSAAVFLAARDVGRVILMAAMTADVVGKGVKAGDAIKEISPVVGGKGGGRPDMAQGGGSDAAKIPEAVTAAGAWLHARLA